MITNMSTNNVKAQTVVVGILALVFIWLPPVNVILFITYLCMRAHYEAEDVGPSDKDQRKMNKALRGSEDNYGV